MQTPREKWFIVVGILFSISIHLFFLAFILNWFNFTHSTTTKLSSLVFQVVPIQSKIIVTPKKIQKKVPKKSMKHTKKNPTKRKKEKITSQPPLPKTSIQSKSIENIQVQFWLSRMQNIWLKHWSVQTKTLKISTSTSGTIEATILRNGKITRIKVVSKSKYPQIDQIAKTTVERINQMPPIPPSYLKDYFTLDFIFHYAH